MQFYLNSTNLRQPNIFMHFTAFLAVCPCFSTGELDRLNHIVITY